MSGFLDPRIRPLVEALSSLEGVGTYSSCEGHNAGEGWSDNYTAPHATFMCDNQETLTFIADRLWKTAWRMVLNDAAVTKGTASHYTLRYVSRDPSVGHSISDIQAEIPEITELLGGKRDQELEDNFPVLVCENCGSADELNISASLSVGLSYPGRGWIPALSIDWDASDVSFFCYGCDGESEPDDPSATFEDLLHRGRIA